MSFAEHYPPIPSILQQKRDNLQKRLFAWSENAFAFFELKKSTGFLTPFQHPYTCLKVLRGKIRAKAQRRMKKILPDKLPPSTAQLGREELANPFAKNVQHKPKFHYTQNSS